MRRQGLTTMPLITSIFNNKINFWATNQQRLIMTAAIYSMFNNYLQAEVTYIGNYVDKL